MTKHQTKSTGDERARLLERRTTTVLAYTKASINWQRLSGYPDTPEYRESRNAREQARVQVELVDHQLGSH